MKVINNSLLGKNFMLYSFKLNETGLFYKNQSEDKKITHEIFITSNPIEILKLMDLNFSDIDKVNDEEFFEILLNCEYFKTKCFVKDNSNGDSYHLAKFAKFLACKNYEFDASYEKITLERLDLIDFDKNVFYEKLKKSTVILKNIKQYKNLSGTIIIKKYPDYDKSKFSETIPKFYSSFQDDIDLKYFMITKSDSEIADYFIETVN